MVKNDRFVSMAVWYARHNAEGAGWFQPNTPKALANLSPGLERSDNPGNLIINRSQPCTGFVAGGTLTQGFSRGEP